MSTGSTPQKVLDDIVSRVRNLAASDVKEKKSLWATGTDEVKEELHQLYFESVIERTPKLKENPYWDMTRY